MSRASFARISFFGGGGGAAAYFLAHVATCSLRCHLISSSIALVQMFRHLILSSTEKGWHLRRPSQGVERRQHHAGFWRVPSNYWGTCTWPNNYKYWTISFVSKPRFLGSTLGGVPHNNDVGFNGLRLQAVDEDAMKAFFDKFDTDANGSISFDECLISNFVWSGSVCHTFLI